MKLSSYDYALVLLSHNPKTIRMMRTTLLAKGYDLAETDKTIEKLISQDYLNDQKFCEAYITSEVVNKGKSLIAVRKKLFEKGMPADIINNIVAVMDDEITDTTIPNLAKEIRKLHKSGKDVLKIYDNLRRKGHRYDDIKSALEYINEKKNNS